MKLTYNFCTSDFVYSFRIVLRTPVGEILVQRAQSKANHTDRTRLGFGIAQLQ